MLQERTYTEPPSHKSRFLGVSLLIVQIGAMVGYGLSGSFGKQGEGIVTLKGQVISLILLFMFVVVGFGMLNNVYRFGNWLGSATAILAVSVSIILSPLLQKFWFSVFITGFGKVNQNVGNQSTVFNFWRDYLQSNIQINTLLMRTTLISCISLMCVMNSVVGRIGVPQLFKFITVFQFFWNLNYFLLIWFLVVNQDFRPPSQGFQMSPYFFDMFGTTFVYLFAAFFALPYSCLIRKQALPQNHPRNQFNRLSLLLSQIGTGFIIAAFVFTHSGVINYSVYNQQSGQIFGRFSTLFGIAASVIGTYVGSSIIGRGRVGFKQTLTGTISGAIIMSSSAPLFQNIGLILMIGFFSGFLSGVYMRSIHIRVNKNTVKDVTGLFGPILISSLLGSVVIVPIKLIYQYNFNQTYKFAPQLLVTKNIAGYQLIYAGISVGVGLGAGLICALISICDSDYFALASNSRIFDNQFGLYDLGQQYKSRQMLAISTHSIHNSNRYQQYKLNQQPIGSAQNMNLI